MKRSILVVLLMAVGSAWPNSVCADSFTLTPQAGPTSASPTNHDIPSLPLAADTVTVKIDAICDLGCAPCDVGNGCNVDPTTKYITITMGQIGDPHTINGAQSYVNPGGTPHPSSPAVPNDGRFFKCWCGDSTPNSCSSTGGCNDWHFAHLGRSYCGGGEGFNQGNYHYFYVDRDTYNAWLNNTPGNTLRIALYGTSSMQNISNYCSSACSVTYNFNSISQVTLTYTPVPTGSCCIPATATCSVTTQAACNTLCGTWTLSGACSPNPCSVQPMGACCFGSGLCVLS